MIAIVIICAVLVAIVAAAAYVRLAPSDPARWHTEPDPVAITDCTRLTTTPDGARVSCLHDLDPAALLARLDSIALATPRTTRLAGSAESGRITWVTRSLLWGFPDYTTAQATLTPQGTRLDVHARLRFGRSDLGVNAARLGAWLGAL